MTKNEFFEMDKSDFNHRMKSSNVSLDEQLKWWSAMMSKYAYDSEAVKECNDKIFEVTKKLADNLNSLSELYVTDRAYFNDFEEYGDTAEAAFERIKQRNYENLKSGLITWEEYSDNVSRLGSVMYNERLSQSRRWLEQERKYSHLSNEEYIAGLERMKDYTAEYYAKGLISYREYSDNIRAISNEIIDKENAVNRAIYTDWLKDAQNWKKARDTYDDWAEHDDSPVKFYERCIGKIEELYRAGRIGWQEYMDETFEYSLDLYKAQMSEADDLLSAQADYIKKLKANISNSEKLLKQSWETKDRTVEISDVKAQMKIYKNAVTEKGVGRYNELAQKLKSLEREEELLRLQKANNKTITALEEEYDAMEKNKKLLLASIQSTGIDVEGLIKSIGYETSGIQNVMTNIASKIINAINSRSTYSDNRSFNISSADSSAITQLTKSMEETIARGRYY